MRRATGRILTGLCVLLVLCIAVGATSAGHSPLAQAQQNSSTAYIDTSGAAASETSQFQSSGTDVVLTEELALVPSQKGTVEARLDYELPDSLQSLRVTLPDEATVRSTRGFTRVEGTSYEWDEATASPGITIRYEVNRSIDQSGPIAAAGDYLYVDVGEWAVTDLPGLSHQWGWTGEEDVGFERQTRAEQGVAGGSIAYLGDYDEYTSTAHGQQFRLVVPASATLAEDRSDLFDAFAMASDRFRVGDRDDEVFALAVPTKDIDWGVRGLARGDADMWVRDTERLNDPINVWLHEYVHTRQDFSPASDLDWFVEGSARYYGAILALERDDISFEQFRDSLANANDPRFDSAVLSDPSTWTSGANYYVGALVTGELDRQLRLSTDRVYSMDEIFRRLNANGGVVTAGDFAAALEAVANESIASLGTTYTETVERPEMWTKQAHGDAFDLLPAQITFRTATTADARRVRGPYRNRTIEDVDPVGLVPGETLIVDIVAENFGGQAGSYTATLQVDEESAGSQSATLQPGEQRLHTFEYQFERTGIYSFSVGDARTFVRVREPAEPAVRSLTTNESIIQAPGGIQLDVTVANGASYPAQLRLPLTLDGTEVASKLVTLDAHSTRDISFEVHLDEPDTYVIGLGNTSSATETVAALTPDTGDDPAEDGEPGENREENATTDGDGTADEATEPAADDGGPGFGFLVGIASLVAVSYGRSRRMENR